jgi:hypothetical protein
MMVGAAVLVYQNAKGLSRVRDGWDEVEEMEARLLRQMTVEESLRQYLALQRAFEPQLQANEHLFRAERLAPSEGVAAPAG